MWKRSGEEGQDLIFMCDYPGCIEISELVYDGRWIGVDLRGRQVYLDETPTLMPIGWKSDGYSHFCYKHKVTFDGAVMVTLDEPTNFEPFKDPLDKGIPHRDTGGPDQGGEFKRGDPGHLDNEMGM